METAIVLCEGQFATLQGKTANSLVRRSERFRIAGVLDSTKAGQDAGAALDGKDRGIPVFKDLDDALGKLDATPNGKPDWLILGLAPPGGRIPDIYRKVVIKAIQSGMSVMSGLHEFLSDDMEFSRLASEHGVRLEDVRKVPPISELHMYDGRIARVGCPRVAVLGTDSSIGKRTTAWILADALNRAGKKAVFVATGQTGLMQGARYGIPLDGIRSDYMVGELEYQVWLAWERERPDFIVVEGQGALSHPVYVAGSRAIVSASRPHGIVLQHDPRRTNRHYGNLKGIEMPMPPLEKDVELVRQVEGAEFCGITLNGMGLTDLEIASFSDALEQKFGVPSEDPVRSGGEKVAKRLLELHI